MYTISVYSALVDLLPEFFEEVTSFQWDAGNSDKLWLRHEVTQAEAEQVFVNRPIVVTGDQKHSGGEVRYFALGKTDASRRLMVAFTIRRHEVRVISARPMSRRERKIYGEGQDA